MGINWTCLGRFTHFYKGWLLMCHHRTRRTWESSFQGQYSCISQYSWDFISEDYYVTSLNSGQAQIKSWWVWKFTFLPVQIQIAKLSSIRLESLQNFLTGNNFGKTFFFQFLLFTILYLPHWSKVRPRLFIQIRLILYVPLFLCLQGRVKHYSKKKDNNNWFP